MTTVAVRTFGVLTAAYGAYALARPEHLQRQAALEPATAVWVGRVVGVRDVVAGVAIVGATTPAARRTVLQVRAALDVVDLAVFGSLATTREGRTRALAAAGSWAMLAAMLARRVAPAEQRGRG